LLGFVYTSTPTVLSGEYSLVQPMAFLTVTRATIRSPLTKLRGACINVAIENKQ